MNIDSQVKNHTTDSKVILWKSKNQRNKLYGILSIPRACDQTGNLNIFPGFLAENLIIPLSNHFIESEQAPTESSLSAPLTVASMQLKTPSPIYNDT